jgi:hypothetical protein
LRIKVELVPHHRTLKELHQEILRSINYGMFLGYREIRVQKDFYFFIIFCQKMKLI